jgi:hypothetical protein
MWTVCPSFTRRAANSWVRVWAAPISGGKYAVKKSILIFLGRSGGEVEAGYVRRKAPSGQRPRRHSRDRNESLAGSCALMNCLGVSTPGMESGERGEFTGLASMKNMTPPQLASVNGRPLFSRFLTQRPGHCRPGYWGPTSASEASPGSRCFSRTRAAAQPHQRLTATV